MVDGGAPDPKLGYFLPAVIAGLGPATPITVARPCPMIGVAGTSPAMTIRWKRANASNAAASRCHAASSAGKPNRSAVGASAKRRTTMPARPRWSASASAAGERTSRNRLVPPTISSPAAVRSAVEPGSVPRERLARRPAPSRRRRARPRPRPAPARRPATARAWRAAVRRAAAAASAKPSRSPASP